MAEYHFANVPTLALAEQTLARARDLYDIIGKLWLRTFSVIAAIFFPGCVALFFTSDLRALLAASLLTGAPFVVWWTFACREAAQYAREMSARGRELKRRNSARRAADSHPRSPDSAR